MPEPHVSPSPDLCVELSFNEGGGSHSKRFHQNLSLPACSPAEEDIWIHARAYRKRIKRSTSPTAPCKGCEVHRRINSCGKQEIGLPCPAPPQKYTSGFADGTATSGHGCTKARSRTRERTAAASGGTGGTGGRSGDITAQGRSGGDPERVGREIEGLRSGKGASVCEWLGWRMIH